MPQIQIPVDLALDFLRYEISQLPQAFRRRDPPHPVTLTEVRRRLGISAAQISDADLRAQLRTIAFRRLRAG